MTGYRADLLKADENQISFNGEADSNISLTPKVIVRQVTGMDIATETVDHLVWDQVLPPVLAHDGALVLLGGGVEVDGGAIAIVAPSGHGKSTLSASLHGAGRTLLGDDALIVDTGQTRPTIRAVYPSLRLLPDVHAAILGRLSLQGEVT